MASNNISQPPPHTVSDYGVTDSARSDEPASQVAIGLAENAKHQERAALRITFFAHTLKLFGTDQPS